MKMTLLKFITTTAIACTAVAQLPPPPPPGSTPRPIGSQPPPPTGTQPPPPGATPPPTGSLPPPPPRPTPPPATATPPPSPPTGTPPPRGTLPPPPPGATPPPTGTRPPAPPPAPPTPQPATAARPGAPLPGLTPAELAAFNAGRAEFVQRKGVADGLGPIFNDVSCVACHNAGGAGGASRIFVTRFGHTDARGVFDPLENLGGSLLQRRAINRAALEIVPPEANTIARRQTTPVFGAGLIEAIPDNTIIALAEREAVDGVKGHVSVVTDIASGEQRIGRFGWKAQQATLLSFSGDAYLNEMGITNRLFPTENAPNGRQDVLSRFDTVADPEEALDPATGRDGVDALADFQRLLAPPAPLPLNAAASAGKALFGAVGCAQCHVPELKTGTHPVAALSEKTVALYSDLLLHDMGALGDGIVQGDAGGREMRTAPLWGLRGTAPYLHDGRAPSVDRAIRAHDGEAAVARDRYLGLTAAQRAQVLAFLNTL